MHIRWSDGHESTFTIDWLQARSFTPEVRNSRLEWMKSTEKNLWNSADMQDKLPAVKFEQVWDSSRQNSYDIFNNVYILEFCGILILHADR